MLRRVIETFECPVCGTAVPAKALACPGCGADEQTGLYEKDGPAYLADSEEDFDYDAFAEKEFGQTRPRSPKDILVAVVAVILIISFGVIVFAY